MIFEIGPVAMESSDVVHTFDTEDVSICYVGLDGQQVDAVRPEDVDVGGTASRAPARKMFPAKEHKELRCVVG